MSSYTQVRCDQCGRVVGEVKEMKEGAARFQCKGCKNLVVVEVRSSEKEKKAIKNY